MNRCEQLNHLIQNLSDFKLISEKGDIEFAEFCVITNLKMIAIAAANVIQLESQIIQDCQTVKHNNVLHEYNRLLRINIHTNVLDRFKCYIDVKTEALFRDLDKIEYQMKWYLNWQGQTGIFHSLTNQEKYLLSRYIHFHGQ